jgi:N-formylglutamate deformylase
LSIFDFHQGALPLLISVPHAGIALPDELRARLTEQGRALPDTDWHVHRLYSFARALGASMIVANYSRYVVDLNRSPDSASLYAGNPTSPVCPTHTFAGAPIYMSGRELRSEEVPARIEQYWRPYHDHIERELEGIRDRHGHALLWDAHSIASEVPGLFEGVLPEFNLGTRDHASCPKPIADSLLELVTRDGKYGAVLNGRFRGGYITQHYGRPAEKIYAVQLELAERTYMDESNPTRWDDVRASSAAEIISRLLARYLKAHAS